MPSNNQFEKIEQYHMGNMSPQDASSFEKELASDPSLRAESDFQSNIIDGIKEHRRLQLKSRLNAIDVSPGWMEFAQQSSLVKSFGGLMIATIVGTGVYFLAEEKPEAVENTAFVSPGSEALWPQIQETDFTWTIPAEKAKESVVNESISSTKKLIVESTTTIKSDEEVVESVDVVPGQSSKTFTPDFSAPDAGDVADEKEVVATVLDRVPTASSLESGKDAIEIETKNSKNSKIKYKYYDGKLFLSGDFNKEPYEILEINSSTGRRIYLLHQRKYYEVKITDRLTELPEVTNIKLIQELRLIKENK